MVLVVWSVACHREGGEERAAQVAAETPDANGRAAQLRAQPWMGDAERNQTSAFQGRMGHSGTFDASTSGRWTATSAGYTLRHGIAAREPLAFPVVDAVAGGARLRLFEGTSFTPDAIRLDFPVQANVDRLSFELAHGAAALVTWGAGEPKLTVYAQEGGARRYQVALARVAATGPLVVGWTPGGEVMVEWRSLGGYSRAFFDGTTGAELVREELDPTIAAVVQDPLAYIRARPFAATQVDSSTNLTTAQRFARDPPPALGSVCAPRERDTRTLRIDELGGERLLIAEAVGQDTERTPSTARHSPEHARCAGVTLYDATKLLPIGMWSTGETR